MLLRVNKNVSAAIEDIKEICGRNGSTSQYFVFGGEGYKSSVRHYLESSTEVAAGAVQPGSTADVSEILKVIAKHVAKFAVKGGGHATNPSFSSTEGGIQISMSRFNKIEVEKDTDYLLPPDSPPFQKHSLVRIGAGCLFDEVYRAVVPHKLNIVGGSSIAGVGVAGWLLGGGYSLKTNQYGLGIDSLVEVEIVLPKDGEIKRVNVLSTGQDKMLFEAVKGGGNNFGIITEFTLRAHTQEEPVHGGLLVYEVEDYEEVKTAVVNFTKQTDPKAVLVTAFRYSSSIYGVESTLTAKCFYDGPMPDQNPFAELLDIDHKTVSGGGDVSGHEESIVKHKNYHDFDHRTSVIGDILDNDVRLHGLQLPLPFNIKFEGIGGPPEHESQPFSNDYRISPMDPSRPDYIKRAMAGIGENSRGRWGSVMVDVYTRDIIDEIGRQASKAAKQMPRYGGKSVVIEIWPFTKSMFDNSTKCAWPHVKGSPNGPIVASFLWEGAGNDQFWVATMDRALDAIQKKVDRVRGEGAKKLPAYQNTSLDSVPVEDIYGDHFEELKAARKLFDPDLVMDLTGGFRIPHPLMAGWELVRKAR